MIRSTDGGSKECPSQTPPPNPIIISHFVYGDPENITVGINPILTSIPPLNHCHYYHHHPVHGVSDPLPRTMCVGGWRLD